MNPRIIPVLLISNGGLYKTVRFKDPKYIGDPVNAVKVFNEKCVDEIIVLDYMATVNNRKPDFILIENIASQCFMPLCYGGGIKSIDDITRIIQCGVEKIALNSVAAENYQLIENTSRIFGSSTVVLSMDVKKSRFGEYEVFIRSATKSTKLKPDTYARQMENCGIGEILVNSVNLDGTMQGYDLELIDLIANAVNVPVIACGGAGNLQHFRDAADNGASAMAAGSLFVFHGKHRGILINYPDEDSISSIFKD
jgi:imidazole glycerol-phosphate synthase subunit HisF